jgi:WD40 repeat protein
MILIHDVASGRQLRSVVPHNRWLFDVSILPDGRRLISRGEEHGGSDVAKVWDHSTGEHCLTLQADKHDMHQVVVSRNGALAASSGYLAPKSYENNLKFWNLKDGSEVHTMPGHAVGTWCLAFSPNGQLLASGGEDSLVRIWDTQTGRSHEPTKREKDAIYSVAFSPNGELLAAGAGDGTVKLWRVSDWKNVFTIDRLQTYGRFLLFTPNGKRLVVVQGPTQRDLPSIQVWDVETRKRVSELPDCGATSAESVALSNDGAKLAACAVFDVVVWDLDASREITRIKGHKSYARSVGFSHDGKLLATGSDDKVIRIWELPGA